MKELKLIIPFFKYNFKRLQIYDKDFYLGIVGLIIENILNLLMLFFIYTLIPSLDGFTFNEMLLLYGVASLSFAIWRCLFINTLNVGSMVRYGRLDTFLLRPISVLYQVMMDGFDDDAWGDLVFALLVIGYTAVTQSINIVWVILLIILSIFTSLIFAGISIVGSSLSFITQGIADFSQIVYNFFQFAKYPINIFGGGMKFVFTFVIPIGWVAAIPVKLLINHNIRSFAFMLIVACGISVIFFWITTKIWNFMLTKYVSTGS